VLEKWKEPTSAPTSTVAQFLYPAEVPPAGFIIVILPGVPALGYSTSPLLLGAAVAERNTMPLIHVLRYSSRRSLPLACQARGESTKIGRSDAHIHRQFERLAVGEGDIEGKYLGYES
jgi:hypothetical protein